MIINTLTRSVILLTSILLLALITSACAGDTEPSEQPAPSEPQASEPAPAAPSPVAMTGDQLMDVVVGFFGAMAESDFDRARTYCTQEFYDETFAEIEEALSSMSEEDRLAMREYYELDEEDRDDLTNAVSTYSDDTATLTITEGDGNLSVFEFVKENGRWKISGGME